MSDLNAAINTAWDKIDEQVLKNLVPSMQKRCVEVPTNNVERQGIRSLLGIWF